MEGREFFEFRYVKRCFLLSLNHITKIRNDVKVMGLGSPMFENRIDLRHGSIWSIIAHFKTDYKNVIKYQDSGAVFFFLGCNEMFQVSD